MSFGDARLDRSFDRWITQTPEEYFGENEEDEEDEEGNIAEDKLLEKEQNEKI